jgi:glucosylceramidase
MVEIWLTDPRQGLLLSPEKPLKLKPGTPQAAIVVNPDVRYQRMAGVGAAISDASAHLIQRALSESQRTRLIKELFEPGTGVAFSLVRVPIGSSDFSLSHYSFNDVAAGEQDPELKQFSISAAKSDLLPVLRAALTANPALTVMASPGVLQPG